MTEIIRKLASIRKIDNLSPIDGADRIEVARIGGWDVIVQKNLYNVDDLALFCEIDAFLPVRPEFEFLRKNCFKSTKNLGDGFRIKSMKMKGVVSQGLLFPIHELSDLNEAQLINGAFEDGDDVTEFLHVQKYEKPIPSNLQGVARGNFPSFIPKTDQERYQNLRKSNLGTYKRQAFEVTIKYDGSSMTVYKNGDDFGVCSRNWNLEDDAENNFVKEGGSENLYWKMARKYDLKKNLRKNLAIQGELVGPGVQGNPMGFEDHHFFVFDIYDIDNQEYLSPFDRTTIVHELQLEECVPVHYGPLPDEDKIFDQDFLMNWADTTTFKTERSKVVPVEGLVFKNQKGDFSFKVISNKYLLAEAA